MDWKNLRVTKKDWDDGWKIIARMGGVTESHARSINRVGALGIVGLILMIFGGYWFFIGLGWFILFGILMGLFFGTEKDKGE